MATDVMRATREASSCVRARDGLSEISEMGRGRRRDAALQYLGVRFDLDEMLRDLRALVREGVHR